MCPLLVSNPAKARISKLEYFFSKKVGEAIAAYNMIEENDRILVAISGGKDSMSLLKVLRYKQKRLPIRFDIVACYIDLGFDDNQRPILENYFRDNGYEYSIEETRLWKRAQEQDGRINCFWCSFNRRKKLFETAAKLGCNKVALGHHKDDIAETFLLNVFFHGEISTMMPRQELFGGKLYIIRPLALCEEKFIIRYARESDFPTFSGKCPNSRASKRKLMKDMLTMLARLNPDVKTNIFRCMKRIKFDYLPH